MKFLVVALVAVMSVSAFAQKHMVQVSTDNQTLGNLSWGSQKARGTDSEETRTLSLSGNYAYSLTDHIQVGGKLTLSDVKESLERNKNIGFQVGGVYNLDTDFRKSLYASLYFGYDWGHNISDTAKNSKTEFFSSTVAVGKRCPLTFISENVTYSPELAFVSENSTKSNNVEWTQALEFRIVQFSVFF